MITNEQIKQNIPGDALIGQSFTVIGTKTATTKQLEYLNKLGYTGAANSLTSYAAGKEIDRLRSQPATAEQRQRLIALRYAGDMSDLTVGEAGDLISQIFDKTDMEAIKAGIKVETLIGQSYALEKDGNYRMQAVDHDSLKIDLRKNTWAWYSQTNNKGEKLGGSVIDWHMYVNNCTMQESLIALSVMLDGGAVAAQPRPKVESKPKVEGWKSAAWQSEARRKLEAAQDRLWNLPEGEPGREYLTSRGIRPDMPIAFDMGYGPAWNPKAEAELPALWIPWQNRHITAIQYRFIGVDKDDKSAVRFGQKGGGVRYLFGMQHCMEAEPGQLDTLILVEGELNAVSLFQTVYGQYPCDVVSFGPQSQLGNPEVATIAAKLAQRYQHVIVWADEPKIAISALGVIPHALPVKTPIIDGEPRDANDLLQLGRLDGVVFELIKRVKGVTA